MIEILGFALIGLVGGISSGLLGIGGAVIMIPALVFFFGFDQKMAQGTTLMLMVPPIGLLGAIEYYKTGHVNIKAAVVIACLFFVGALIGGKLAVNLDMNILKKVFAVFLMFIAVRMFFS